MKNSPPTPSSAGAAGYELVEPYDCTAIYGIALGRPPARSHPWLLMAWLMAEHWGWLPCCSPSYGSAAAGRSPGLRSSKT
jgi:hypothetical protein